MTESPTIESTDTIPAPTPTSPPALTKDDREKLKTKLLLKHLRKNRVITLGTVLFITCLISAGLIEIYLRWFLPPGSGTAIQPDFTGSFKDPSDRDEEEVWTDMEDSDPEKTCSIKGISKPVRRRYRVLIKRRNSVENEKPVEFAEPVKLVDTAENSDSGLLPDHRFYTIEQIRNGTFAHAVAISSDEESVNEDSVIKISNSNTDTLPSPSINTDAPAPKLSPFAEHAKECPLIAVTNLEITFKEPESASLPIPTRFITLKDETRPPYTYTTLADIVDNYVPFTINIDALDAVKQTSRDALINELAALYAFISALLNYALSISVYLEFSHTLLAYHSFFTENQLSLKKLSTFAENWSLFCDRLRVSTHSVALRALKNIHKCPIKRPFSPSLTIRTITDFYLQYDSVTFGDSSEYKLFLIDPTLLPTVSESSLSIKGEYQKAQWLPTLHYLIILIESLSSFWTNFNHVPQEACDFGVKELFFMVNYYNETVLRLQVPEIRSIEREIVRTLRDPSFVAQTVHDKYNNNNN